MPDFSAQDKFNPDKSFTQVKFGGGAGAKLLEVELNEMQRIQAEARAELIRMSVHSGVLDYASAISSDPTVFATTSVSSGVVRVAGQEINRFLVGKFSALVNGYKLPVVGHATEANYANKEVNKVSLAEPPTFGSRDDLVFLEAWFEEVSTATVPKFGGTDSGTINSDIVDTRIGQETSRRVQLKWRIRTVAGVDFNLLTMDGLAISSGWYPATADASKRIMAQGGNTTPITDTTQYLGAFKSPKIYDSNTTPPSGSLDDKGLFYCGNGTQAAKDLLKTADGYVYAIPLFRVKRRNSGGYRVDNLNGARDYLSLTLTNANTVCPAGGTLQLTTANTSSIKVGDIIYRSDSTTLMFQVASVDSSTQFTVKNLDNYNPWTLGTSYAMLLKSDRPDGKYSNIIHQDDIIDLRHKVSLTGFNFDQVLEENFDKLIRGELNTKDTKTLNKEQFNLASAPYGAVSQLRGVVRKGADGVDRVLVNLLGTDGDCEDVSKWSLNGSTIVLDSSNKVYGNNGIKITTTGAIANLGTMLKQNYPIDNTKYYLFMLEGKNGTADNIKAFVDNLSTSSKSGAIISDSAQFKNSYVKLSPTDLAGKTVIHLHAYVQGSSGKYAYADGIRLYEIDQATYDKIDVDAGFTGDALAKKFPYVNSYPNIVENLFDKNAPYSSFGSVVVSHIPEGIKVKGSTNQYDRITFPLQLKPSTVYVAKRDIEIITAGTNADNGLFRIMDGTASTPITSLRRTDSSKITSFTTPSDGKITVMLYATWNTTENAEFNFSNIIIEEGSARKVNLDFPYGRWQLPYDIANGDTKLRTDYANKNRQIISDRQISETHSTVVEPLRTPQKHIKVTQATEGVWAVNDTIKVSSEEGVISGVIDSDTALARIVEDGTNLTVIKLDDVSKIAVNDTVQFIDPTTWASYSRTVTAVDTVAKTITVNNASTVYTYYLISETTASTSSPVVTATGIAGTWSGLGTREATYTITTAPTTNTDKIKLQYSVNYPAGKGIQQIPDMQEARVNTQKLVKSSDGKFTMKANFEGKIANTFDRVPHKSVRGESTALIAPSGFGTEDSAAVSNIQKIDGVNATKSSLITSNYAQHLFSFDVIRAITDRLGDGVFADCVTLADKVAKAKVIVTKLLFNWHGYGSSPTGNKASVSVFTNTNTWADIITHTSATVAKLARSVMTASIFNVIDANGFVHFNAYADPSDGVTASTINTDYVELEIELSLAETGYDVFVPEQQFPVRVEQTYQEGENMVPPFSQWNITPSFTVNGLYDLTLNAPTTSLISDVDFGVLPNTSYNISADRTSSTGSIGDCRIQCYWLDSSGTIIGSVVNVLVNNTSSTIISPANASKIRLRCAGIAIGIFTFKNIMLTPGNKAYPFVPQTRIRKSKRVLDFLGKVPGSMWENPHLFKPRIGIIESSPTHANYVETTSYSNLSVLDGNLRNSVTGLISGHYAQHLFEFDLAHLGLSLSELKRLLRKLTISWTGYGQGNFSNPTVAPTLELSPDGGASLVDGTTYYVAYSWVTASGDTLLSPEASIVATAGNRINITVPTLPAGATGWRRHVGTVSGQLYSPTSAPVINAPTTTSTIQNPSAYTVPAPTINTAGFGALIKIWRASASAWEQWDASTTSTPTTKTPSSTTTLSNFVTNDQKIYVLVHTTNPASDSVTSTLYTDYIKLEVDLSEEVDYVKGNIIKVMKETKEVKAEYRPTSYTNGVTDALELFYNYQPYQGTGITTAHIVLTKPDVAMITTVGTGAVRPTAEASIYFQPIAHLPLGNGFSDHQFTNDIVAVAGAYVHASNANFDALLISKVPTEEMLHATSNTYKSVRVGQSHTIGTSVIGKRGWGSYLGRNYRRIRPAITCNGHYLITMCMLALIEGEIHLVVLTQKNNGSLNTFVIDGTSLSAVDVFKITGRPLIKGGI